MPLSQPAQPETVFTYGAPQLKYGHGAADEIGYDLAQTGAKRALVVTDPGLAATGTPQRVADQMTQFGIEAVVFDGTHVEPTDRASSTPSTGHGSTARGMRSSRSAGGRPSTPPRRST
jgi:hypothetical protein